MLLKDFSRTAHDLFLPFFSSCTIELQCLAYYLHPGAFGKIRTVRGPSRDLYSGHKLHLKLLHDNKNSIFQTILHHFV